MRKIIVTGAAGLVGQNLVAELKSQADIRLVGIDKHAANVALFRQVHPSVEIIEADLSRQGDWGDAFAEADAVAISQAQIGGLFEAQFIANNVVATKNILAAIEAQGVPYFVGVSSSVVNSAADDFYTRSKAAQEKLYDASPVSHVVLRPTMMFGWFDRKHLGWLRWFMDRSAVFPIPGDGNFPRQPLYVGDFVSIVATCIEHRTTGSYDISGMEQISYRALIETIHSIVRPHARIVHVPYALFWALLYVYTRFDRDPPFTTRQLEALVIPEIFPLIDWSSIFGVAPTPLREAIEETYLNPVYGRVFLEY